MLKNINITDISITGRGRIIESKRPVQFPKRASNAFVLFLSGEIDFYYKNTRISARENTFVFLPQGVGYHTLPSQQGEFLIINFFTANPLGEAPFALTPENSAGFRLEFDRAIKAYRYKGTGYKEEIKACIFMLVSLLERERFDKDIPYIYKKRINKAREYIGEDPDISVGELALKLNVSTKYLTKMFVACVNLSPGQYIILQRLEAAGEKLVCTRKPVGEIALECGFCDVYYFSRMFKKHMGVTPTEYRRGFM